MPHEYREFGSCFQSILHRYHLLHTRLRPNLCLRQCVSSVSILESLITLFYYLCWQQGRQEMCRCCGTERCEFRAPRGCSAAMLRRHLAGVERADPHAYAAATQPLRRKRRNSTSLPSHIYACSQRCKVYFRMVRQSASFCRSREVPLPNEASYESAKTDFNLIYSG